jgi:hypothetical protein
MLMVIGTDCIGSYKSECNFQQYFSYIMATSFSGGGSRSTRREPPTLGKQLVNFITCLKTFLDAINLGNILHKNQSNLKKIPLYFKDLFVTILH